MRQAPVVYSLRDLRYFGDLIASALGVAHYAVARKVFGGGEQYYRLEVPDVDDPLSLLGRDVVVVGATHSDDNLLELYRLGCQLADLGTRRRIFVIPFLGYSTMDQAKFTGEVVTAKWVIHLLSTMPKSSGNCFLSLDLHSSQLLGCFSGDCLRFELSGKRVLVEAAFELGLDDFMFGSADLGRAKQVKALAQAFGRSAAFVEKTRDFDRTKVLNVFGEVQGKTVVLYDDMIRSAGTLLDAANAYLEHGAAAVYGIASHLALDSVQIAAKLASSPLEKVIVTDSHPMSQQPLVGEGGAFVVCSVSHVFTAAIGRILDLDP